MGSSIWVINYSPDIIQDFITVEIKRDRIDLRDIYQAKMYGDLFRAKYALLISFRPIPEEIRRLDTQVSVTKRFPRGWVLYIGELYVDEHGDMIISNWLPNSPF